VIELIRFYDVTKVYPSGATALLSVNTFIEKGEFVFLVGSSGAGKTTFLKLLRREIVPTRGQVLLNGRNIARLRPREVPHLRRTVRMIFQDYKLLPNKTVYDNVAFALTVIEKPERQIGPFVDEALKLVGLESKDAVYPHELSGGEQQRVSIARAIVGNPTILLADEPTGNLDMETSWDIMEVLLRVNRKGTTVIMSTHNAAIVDGLRQRVIELNNGRIVRDDRKGVYESEAEYNAVLPG
jgi:cell division transport system ATP-binding protein